jgi:hypothetical protein
MNTATHNVEARLSRGVHRTEVLPVPVCPTVLSKPSFHPLEESIKPLGENALECSMLRWLSHCFLVNTVVFLPQALRLGTHTLFSYQGTVDLFYHRRAKVEMRLSARAFHPRHECAGLSSQFFVTRIRRIP